MGNGRVSSHQQKLSYIFFTRYQRIKIEIILRRNLNLVRVLLSMPMQTLSVKLLSYKSLKIVSEYDQKIPQSQTADNPVAPRGRDAQPSRDTRKTN